jgi:hypothetical protein
MMYTVYILYKIIFTSITINILILICKYHTILFLVFLPFMRFSPSFEYE